MERSAARPEVLLIDDDGVTRSLVAALQATYSVTATSQIADARELLRQIKPALLVMELDVVDGAAAEICREAKSVRSWTKVLVTSGTAARVPDALAAGCDEVLMKPFPLNLLCARMSRILRVPGVSKRVWPMVGCPHCGQGGSMSFDVANRSQAWYACLTCRKAWLGPDRTRPQFGAAKYLVSTIS
jgi:DNA-binding response OmpR family regulator